MKRTPWILLLIAVIITLLPVPLRADTRMVNSYETAVKYSVAGGRIKRIEDDSNQYARSHNYKGEIKVGETITLRYAGIRAFKSIKGTEGAIAINPMSPKRRIEGMLKEAESEKGMVSGHMSYTVEPDVTAISAYVTFTSYVLNPAMGAIPYTAGMWIDYKVVEKYSDEPGFKKATDDVKKFDSLTADSLPPGDGSSDAGDEEEEDTDYEEDNYAQDSPGIGSYLIPAAVISIIIGGGAAIRKKNKKKKEDGSSGDGGSSGGDKQGEEEEEPEATYSMYLYKDFGNTLVPGDPPRQVYAQIVKIVKDQATPDARLTSMIEITSGAYLNVVQTGMHDGWMSADVDAPDRKDAPDEGIVTFRLAANGGSYTNRIHFKIDNGRIEFFQENLTLPVGYEEVSRLPFVVYGADEDADVKAEIPSSPYTVELEQDAKINKLWYAVIRETSSTKEKKQPAGHYTVHSLNVKVDKGNNRFIEGSLPVMRFQMGLIFECDGMVGCYSEKFDPGKHPKHLKFAYNGKYYAPALTRATMSLLTWDEEEHKLKRLVPAEDDTLFQPIPLPDEQDQKETDFYSKETQGMSDQQVLDKLNLQFFVNQILPDGSSIAYIHSCAILDAPARRKVRLHLEVKYKDVKYEAERDAWLISQPLRTTSVDDSTAEGEEDDRITDNLTRISEFIINHDLLDRIGPVYKLANMLLDSYDPRFGYDPELVYVVQSKFLRFVSGETLGANADAEPVETPGLAAELLQSLALVSEQAEDWLEKHGGVWTRLAIGAVTLGWSETALQTVKIAKDMVDVANRPFNPGGAWEAFCVGVKTVTIDFLTEQLWKADMVLGAEVVAKYHPELAANAANLMSKAAGKVKDKLGVLGKDVREVAGGLKQYFSNKVGAQMSSRFSNTGRIQRSMSDMTDDMLRDFRKTADWTPEELLEDSLGRAANRNAIKEIKEFEHLCIEYRRYKTPEAKEAFRRFCYRCQGDKTMQKQLALYQGEWANNLRSEYYRILQEDYHLVDKDALREASQRLRQMGENVSEDDLEIFCATNSNKTALYDGDALTRDRDLTMLKKSKPTRGNPNPVPTEIPQDIAEECYGNAYKKRTGLSLEEGDQAVVQKGSKEMIGAGEEDLKRAFKKEHFGEQYTDLDGVAEAFKHKPEAWIKKGADLRKLGDTTGALRMEGEGLRQAFKEYFNSLEPRGTYRGTLNRLTKTEQQVFYVVKKVEDVKPGPMSISVTECRKLLRERFHIEITDIPEILKNIVYKLEG